MAETTIKMIHGDVESQAKQLATMKNDLEQQFKQALAQVQLLHSEGAFQGLAGASFQERYNEWNTSITQTLQLMESFGSHLGKASAAFGQVDAAFKL